jgi:hypothetical protein
MLAEAFHPFRKRHTALRRSNGIENKLFEQVTAEEWVTQASGGNLKRISRGPSLKVSERRRMS